jgi:hypothetical protein
MAQRQWRSDDTDKWVKGFGDGSDGSSYSVPANEGCSGTAAGTSVTLASAGSFANGDLVVIHQSRGTGVGNWELNKIASGATTTSLTMEYDLMNTYTDSGSSQAQMLTMHQYENLSLGATSAPEWDGSKGGIIAFFDKGEAEITGAINLKEKGHRGGSYNGRNNNLIAFRGEGSNADGRATGTYTADGSAAGGGENETSGDARQGAGGGGGHATSGGNGTALASGQVGLGGGTVGGASLVSANFGGGGGGAGTNWNDSGWVYPVDYAGDGGGFILVISKKITITGSIDADGGDGPGSPSGNSSGYGGGAGGSVLIKAETATLGSSLITADGGTGTYKATQGTGGNGGDGRIHLDYSKSYTGTTSPTIDVTNDVTIKVGGGGSFLNTFLAFG